MFANARARDLEISDAGMAGAVPDSSKPVWRDRLGWIALAFVPSGLLVAFTMKKGANIVDVCADALALAGHLR